MPSTFALAVNDFRTTLASAHAAGSGVLVLQAQAGARLGTLPASRIYRVTAVQDPDTASEVILGIFEATGLAGDTLTGVTAAEGTTDPALAAGVTIDVRMTAKDLGEIQAAVNALEAQPPDKNYLFTQPTPAATWTIDHNLGKYPCVTVIDSSGAEVEGEVIHASTSSLTLSFSGAFSGSATLN